MVYFCDWLTLGGSYWDINDIPVGPNCRIAFKDPSSRDLILIQNPPPSCMCTSGVPEHQLHACPKQLTHKVVKKWKR